MIARLLGGIALVLAFCAPGRAEDTAKNTSGRFDFYVLALSWSPGFCALGDNRAARRDQCGPGGPGGFVVHGLWPQYERGFPDYCGRAGWVPDALIREMADIMPSRGLVIGQWRKHGTCSGLDPAAYFALLRRAHDAVRIPPAFRDGAAASELDPDAIETAFARSNPGLEPDMMAVRCGDRTFSEIRICMTRDLEFRACPEVDARACRAPAIRVPAGAR